MGISPEVTPRYMVSTRSFMIGGRVGAFGLAGRALELMTLGRFSNLVDERVTTFVIDGRAEKHLSAYLSNLS
jgi:hypothetical protein